MSSVIEFRPRSPTRATAQPGAARHEFDGLRGRYLSAWKAWLATSPTPKEVHDEIEATASAMRQLEAMARETGT